MAFTKEHRVVIPEEEIQKRTGRQSLGFFVFPDDHTIVYPPKYAVDHVGVPGPLTSREYYWRRVKSIQKRGWILRRYNANHHHKKRHVNAATDPSFELHRIQLVLDCTVHQFAFYFGLFVRHFCFTMKLFGLVAHCIFVRGFLSMINPRSTNFLLNKASRVAAPAVVVTTLQNFRVPTHTCSSSCRT